jgi:hypothetical protein
VVAIVAIGGSKQHAGVDDQRQRPNPSASMSSASAAVRPVSDALVATNPSLRRAGMCSASTRAPSSSAVTDWRAASSASRAARSSERRTFTLMSRVYRRRCRPEAACLLKIEGGRGTETECRPAPGGASAIGARDGRSRGIGKYVTKCVIQFTHFRLREVDMGTGDHRDAVASLKATKKSQGVAAWRSSDES